MTIKFRLIINIIITTLLIAMICVAGYSSLKFIKERFRIIAEKSAPSQIRSMEFERELQHCIASLTRILAVRDGENYPKFKSEAESSLKSLAASEKELAKLRSNTSKLNVSDNFNRIALELFSSSEARLLSEKQAFNANEAITERIAVSSAKLKKLENSVRQLQESRSAEFTKSLENTNAYSSRLRGLEDLQNNVKELHGVLNNLKSSDTKMSFLISRGKINVNLFRIEKNRYVNFVASEIKNINDNIRLFIKLKDPFLIKKDQHSTKQLTQLFKNLMESSNFLQLILNQEIELLASHLEGETKREALIYDASNKANAILLNNSSLVTLAHSIAADITRLFSFETLQEVEALNKEIQAKFLTLHNLSEGEERNLVDIGAFDEVADIRSAHEYLETIRYDIVSKTGLFNILKNRLQSRIDAENSGERLRIIAEKQAAIGRDAVVLAKSQQENAIQSVNMTINSTISRVGIIGLVASILGMIFGYWILHFVLNPLKIILHSVRQQTAQVNEKALLAKQVAAGNLNLNLHTDNALLEDLKVIKNDEFGKVLQELVGMSQAQETLDNAFYDMTQSLRKNRFQDEHRNRVKDGLVALNRILRTEQQSINSMADQTLSYLMGYLGAAVGVFYGLDETNTLLKPLASYSVQNFERIAKGFSFGEGIVGEAALQRKVIILDSVPKGYLPIESALGCCDPVTLVAMPMLYNDVLAGVLEFGSFKQLTDDDFNFLQQALEGVAIALNVTHSQQRCVDLP